MLGVVRKEKEEAVQSIIELYPFLNFFVCSFNIHTLLNHLRKHNIF